MCSLLSLSLSVFRALFKLMCYFRVEISDDKKRVFVLEII